MCAFLPKYKWDFSEENVPIKGTKEITKQKK